MKKSQSKLTFQKTTIRLLQAAELTEVVGGGPTAECTLVQTVCICLPGAAPTSPEDPTAPAR